MVKGRVVGELIIVSVAAIVLLVILGLRYISGSAVATGTSGQFAGVATSSLFLTLLFMVIVAAVVAVESWIRLKERRVPRGSKNAIFDSLAHRP